MTSSLKLNKIYESITINEKYAKTLGTNPLDNDEYKDSMQTMFSDKYRLSKDQLQRIYEIEYKLFILNNQKKKEGGWLRDRFYNIESQWRSELINLLQESVENLYNVMLNWSIVEEHMFIVPEKYGRPEEENLTMSKEDKEELVAKAWNEEPYKTVNKIMQELQTKRNSKNISELIILFHKALTTAHNNGSMLEFAIKNIDMEAAERYLDELSDGKHIPAWNKELKDMGILKEQKLSLEQAVSNSNKHPDPEELAKVLSQPQ